MAGMLTASSNDRADTEIRHLEFNYKLLKYFGLWPNGTKPKKFWELFRSLLPALLLSRAVIMMVFNTYALRLIWNIPHLRSNRFAIIIGCVLVIFKLWTLMIHKDKIADIIYSLEIMNGDSYFVDDKCEVLKAKTKKWCQMMSKILLYSMTIMIVFVFVLGRSVILESFMIPFNMIFPERTQLFYIFLIIFLPLHFVGVTELSTIVAFDVIWLVITIQTIVQFHILGYKLENIRKIVKRTSELRAFSPSPEVVSNPTLETTGSSNTLTHVPEEDESISIRSEFSINAMPPTEEALPRGCRPPSCDATISCAHINTPQSDFDIDMEKYLEGCVKHHLALMKICTDGQQIFNTVLRCQILLAATMSMMALHISILSSKVGGLNDAVIIGIFFFVASIFELFVMSIMCDKLTEKSSRIRDAAYACDWLEATEGFKRSLRIIMCRTMKPVVIKAMGIPISLRSFRTMMRAVYYTHTLSLNIINGKKIVSSKNLS